MANEGDENTINKLIKDKREREPNWTEPEKQLLLSLTRIHRNVLDNKSSDTMTILLKSQVWDEIASNMLAAGYNRSKERLKQQLGRIRAAEAKKMRGALTNSIQNNQNADVKFNFNSNLDDKDSKVNQSTKVKETILHKSSSETSMALKENIKIKSDKSSASDEQNTEEGKKEFLSTLPNTTSLYLNHSNNHTSNQPETSEMILENIDVISKVHTSNSNDLQVSKLPMSTYKTNYNSSDSAQLDIDIDHSNHRSTAKGMRQLQLYRIAAERERIRALKLQQKHDRIMEREHLRMLRQQQKRNYVLYQKDVQIQNLKVQLLQDMLKSSDCDASNALQSIKLLD